MVDGETRSGGYFFEVFAFVCTFSPLSTAARPPWLKPVWMTPCVLPVTNFALFSVSISFYMSPTRRMASCMEKSARATTRWTVVSCMSAGIG